MSCAAEAGAFARCLEPAFRSALLLVIIISLLIPSGAARAGGGPRDVLIVINNNSAVSREIGRYYQAARGIPDSNICNISCPDQEVVSASVCQTFVVEPIRRFLARPDVIGKIDYIVLTKGIPLAATYPLQADLTNSSEPYSVASVLTCLECPDITDVIANPYGPLALWQWGMSAPETAWSHSLDFMGYHFYLATRLDAYTVALVKNMIDHSICTALDGSYVLDKNNYTSSGYLEANKRLGDLAGSAYAKLTAGGFQVYYDPGSTFISDRRGLMGYFSWASHDNMYSFSKFVSNQFVPGSIGDTYYSYSGKTFTDPGTTNRPPLIADLFAMGLCGAGGYVSEPQISTATYPNLLFDRYTKGYNMAESFYAACPQLFWKTVVVGDPLMAPYAHPPTVNLNLPGSRLTGLIVVTATASDLRGVSKVMFFWDNKCLGTVTQQPYTIKLDTTLYPIGGHTLEAIAYENSPVASQGSCKASVIVDNLISPEAKIGDIYDHPDGQLVKLTDKVVTAGTQEVGGAFYIEESDRSSGVRINWPDAVNRGDIVTLVGAVRTYSGDRVIDATSVIVTTSGAKTPSPLMMSCRSIGGTAVGHSLSVGSGSGARNVSLLVKLAGRVMSSGNGEFSLSDGSVDLPVKVLCPGLSVPSYGKLVAVTGVSVIDSTSGRCMAALRTRDSRDLQPLN